MRAPDWYDDDEAEHEPDIVKTLDTASAVVVWGLVLMAAGVWLYALGRAIRSLF